MKVALRDLFWFVLIAAIGMAWGMEHMRVSSAFANARRTFHRTRVRYDDEEGDARRQRIQREIRALSNQELLTAAKDPLDVDQAEPYWLEMSRRQMVDELRMIYHQAKESATASSPFRKFGGWDNGRLLTALRRAEGKPDPIRIEIVSMSNGQTNYDSDPTIIIPKIVNCDVDHESFYLTEGGDDRGGRHDRWRVHLTNAKGELQEDARFRSLTGGGLASAGMLRHGGTIEFIYRIDARSYVKPPPSGRYSLQLIHAEEAIAFDRDLSGRIVWKSAPVPVIVENFGQSSHWLSAAIPVVIFFGAVSLAATDYARRMFFRSAQPVLRRHDWIAILFIGLLCCGWLVNITLMKGYAERIGLDLTSSWTIRLAE